MPVLVVFLLFRIRFIVSEKRLLHIERFVRAVSLPPFKFRRKTFIRQILVSAAPPKAVSRRFAFRAALGIKTFRAL